MPTHSARLKISSYSKIAENTNNVMDIIYQMLQSFAKSTKKDSCINLLDRVKELIILCEKLMLKCYFGNIDWRRMDNYIKHLNILHMEKTNNNDWIYKCLYSLQGLDLLITELKKTIENPEFQVDKHDPWENVDEMMTTSTKFVGIDRMKNKVMEASYHLPLFELEEYE